MEMELLSESNSSLQPCNQRYRHQSNRSKFSVSVTSSIIVPTQPTVCGYHLLQFIQAYTQRKYRTRSNMARSIVTNLGL